MHTLRLQQDLFGAVLSIPTHRSRQAKAPLVVMFPHTVLAAMESDIMEDSPVQAVALGAEGALRTGAEVGAAWFRLVQFGHRS
jgi:hypothetical protein